jgi:hypothetical protein
MLKASARARGGLQCQYSMSIVKIWGANSVAAGPTSHKRLDHRSSRERLNDSASLFVYAHYRHPRFTFARTTRETAGVTHDSTTSEVNYLMNFYELATNGNTAAVGRTRTIGPSVATFPLPTKECPPCFREDTARYSTTVCITPNLCAVCPAGPLKTDNPFGVTTWHPDPSPFRQSSPLGPGSHVLK